MIPQTVVGFFFFLLLVAPGVSYELLRERRTPKLNQTTFREVSRVALYSFWFSLASCAIIALLRTSFPHAIFDPAAYIRDKDYVKSSYAAIGWTVLLEVLIAFALVLVADQLGATKLFPKAYAKFYPKFPAPLQKILSRAKVRRHGLWFELFEAIPDNTEAQLSIRLTDGSRMSGFFHACTAYDTFEHAEIGIKKGKTSSMWMLDRQDASGQEQPYTQEPQQIDSDVIWVRGDDISYMKVDYALIPNKAKKNPNIQRTPPRCPPRSGAGASRGRAPGTSLVCLSWGSCS